MSHAAFSPDGSRIITASSDDTVRVWDAATGAEIIILKGHGASVYHVAFSPDGSRIVTASLDQTARVWQFTLQTTYALIDRARQVAPRCLTSEQRELYHLSPEPPSWCIEMRKWPYETDAWRDWLAEERSGGNPKMPSE